VTGSLPGEVSHSRFVQRIRRRYRPNCRCCRRACPTRQPSPRWCSAAAARPRAAVGAARGAPAGAGAPGGARRRAGRAAGGRHRRDDALAEATLELALAQALAEQDERHGVPRDAAGQRIDFWIVGMGKLGARELNVSSDIDLIYVYEDDGQTDGCRGRVSAHEYFAGVAKRLYALIGDTTDDGFVFRVDLALRPNGNSGPPVVSLAMLEEYLQVQGREWERFAWLKSRVVAPRASVAAAARWRCARWSRPSSTGATWTTASSRACASCTARSATRRSAAPPAGPSAPTTSSSRAAASARSSSSCS
jgi:glutamate-ammonia-ligase adenylyltransferase